MQTFLPYSDFKECAKVIDYKRLGKQRVEAMQIMKSLQGVYKSGAWSKHPAVLMWSGYEKALAIYYNCILTEWIDRGYNNNMCFMIMDENSKIIYPKWLGDERLHSSHRSALLHKDIGYYNKFGWKEIPELNYFWPSKKGEK